MTAAPHLHIPLSVFPAAPREVISSPSIGLATLRQQDFPSASRADQELQEFRSQVVDHSGLADV